MRVADLYRYPVKSMGGERLMSTALTDAGIPGDRAWALRDEVRGEVTGAKKLPRLMSLSARFASEPSRDAPSPEVRIADGNGLDVSSASGDVDARLSAAVGHPVSLWPLLPAEELEQFNHETPPRPYFDAYPLLIMTRSSLAAIAERAAASGIDARFDVRRFRPNVLLEVDEEGFAENAWEGRRLRIGGAEVAVEMRCPRCIMTTHGFGELPRDPRIMRALARHNDGNLGVYASVVRAGEIEVGDAAEVL